MAVPANGSVALVEGGVQYTPNLNYLGADSFTYEVTDTDGGTSAETATVAINVLPINDAPIAEDDLAGTPEDESVSIDVLDNDSDVDSPISVSCRSTILPTATVEFGDGDELVYTPNENFFGEDAFTYTITDGELESHGNRDRDRRARSTTCPSRWTTWVWTPMKTPRCGSTCSTTTPTSKTTPADLTITIVDGPANGSVALVEGGVEYTPNADYNGADSFTYEVTDTDGGTSAETATVEIDVLPINDAPDRGG